MRERFARLLALSTLMLALVLAAVFAWRQSTRMPGLEPPVQSPPAAAEPARLALGRAVLEREGCLQCHALGGSGNPRSPLDGIGARRPAADIRQWIVADAAVADRLPARIAQVKQRYRALPEDELDALIEYLLSR